MATHIIGDTISITWDSDNIPTIEGTDQIMIELSIDGDIDVNYSLVPNQPQDNTGTYSWLVPEYITTNGFIRISAVDNDTGLRDPDRSLVIGPFEITYSGTVIAVIGNVVNSNEGNLKSNIVKNITGSDIVCGLGTMGSNVSPYIVGYQYPITWDSSNIPDVDMVMIELSVNNEVDYSPLPDQPQNNTGSYLWTVQDSITDTGFIRISAIDNDTGLIDLDRSLTLGPFSIVYYEHTASVNGQELVTGEGTTNSNISITVLGINIAALNGDLIYTKSIDIAGQNIITNNGSLTKSVSTQLSGSYITSSQGSLSRFSIVNTSGLYIKAQMIYNLNIKMEFDEWHT